MFLVRYKMQSRNGHDSKKSGLNLWLNRWIPGQYFPFADKCGATDKCCACHYLTRTKGGGKKLKWWFVAIKSNTQQSTGNKSFHSGGQGPYGSNSFPGENRNQSADRNNGVLKVKEQVWVSEQQTVLFLCCCQLHVMIKQAAFIFSLSLRLAVVSFTWNIVAQSVGWLTAAFNTLVACL